MDPLCPLLDKALGVQSEVISHVVLFLVTQLCSALSDLMDCKPTGLLIPWGFSRQKNWAGLPGLPPSGGFPHCKQILYCMSHQGSPRILEWVAYPVSRGTSQPRNWTRVSCIASQFFPYWATKETLISPHSFLLLTFSLTLTILFSPLLFFMLLDILTDEVTVLVLKNPN